MNTFDEFKEFLQVHFKQHPHLKRTIDSIDCFIYLKNNIAQLAQSIGPERLIRHPKNHLAIHLVGDTPEAVMQYCLSLIQEVEKSFIQLLAVEPTIRNDIISCYLFNINDSAVGCMEARWRRALTAFALFQELGCQELNELMEQFSRSAALKVEEVLDFFSERIEHHIPVLNQQKQITLLSWDLVKVYLSEILAWEDIDRAWDDYGVRVAANLKICHKARPQWIFIYFEKEGIAKRYLSYIKSRLPNDATELAKAEVNYANEGKYYFFRLKPGQYDRFLKLFRENYFLVKTLRADKDSYFRNFALSITRSPVQQQKIVYRPSPKKLFTVKGEGVEERSKKIPQYTKEEKELFSDIQSTSLVTKSYYPPLFGFNRLRRDKLVGIMLSLEHALVNRLLQYDGGTVNRPFEHESWKDAQEFFLKKTNNENQVLFSSLEIFVEILSQALLSGYYNEVLARIRWVKEVDSKIIIGSDTFEARLIALDYARILRNRLMKQAQELNEPWDDTYIIPLCFYLPGDPQHLQLFLPEEQKKDQESALAIFRDKAQRLIKYQEGNSEFLLGLSGEIIAEAMADNFLLEELRLYVYTELPHIVLSLLEKIGLSTVTSEKILPLIMMKGKISEQLIKKLLNTGELIILIKMKLIDINSTDRYGYSVLMLIIKNDVTELALKLINTPTIALNWRSVDCCSALLLALERNNQAVLVALINHPMIELNLLGKNNITPLIYAAAHNRVEALDLFLAQQEQVSINFQMRDTSTAVIQATLNGHLNAVATLLKFADIDVNLKYDAKTSALKIAAIQKYYDIFALLLSHSQTKAELEDEDLWSAFLALKELKQYGNKESIRHFIKANYLPAYIHRLSTAKSGLDIFGIFNNKEKKRLVIAQGLINDQEVAQENVNTLLSDEGLNRASSLL